MALIARFVLGAALSVGLAGGVQAVTITDATTVSPADRQAINADEAEFFARLERDGAEKAVSSLFPTAGASEATLAAMKELDRNCGVATKADRYKTVTFGSRAVRDEFVVLMGSCLVKWELTYLKTGVAWKLNNVHFNSSPGDW